MNPWLEGAVLTRALLGGGAVGWMLGVVLGLRSPNVAVTTLLLVAGSLGGPLVTTLLLGQTLLAAALALLIAGATAGFAFWPMGQRQGEREWL